MFKAMALICSAWIANGEAKQACFTHMFEWEFLLSCQRTLILSQYCVRRMCKGQQVMRRKRECQMRLIYYRAKF